mmetsp:Transcript_14428/g.27322  ORF Transcript_14428/g.27322 Transcript_14428/m.27322 type:complete len:104 (+) Transcript_14428:206-517(+)
MSLGLVFGQADVAVLCAMASALPRKMASAGTKWMIAAMMHLTIKPSIRTESVIGKDGEDAFERIAPAIAPTRGAKGVLSAVRAGTAAKRRAAARRPSIIFLRG